MIVLTSAGAIDTSFSGDGFLPLPSVKANSDVLPLAFQADGKLVVTGTESTGIWVGRFTTLGTFDPFFDLDGERQYARGGVEDRPRAIAISAGRLYIATRSGANVGLFAVIVDAVVAGLPDETFAGKPDTSFSDEGEVIVPSGGSASEPVDITITPTGALHVASRVVLAGGERAWEITETSSAGVWNTAFLTLGRFTWALDGVGGPVAVSTDGSTTTLVGEDGGDMVAMDVALVDAADAAGSSVARRVNLARMPSFVDLADSVVSADSRVVSLGTVTNGLRDDDIDAVLVALRANGSRDRSYGTRGAVHIGHPGGSANGIDITEGRAGGVIALVGTRGPSNSGYVVHARTSSGQPEARFGVDGRRTLPVVNDIEATTTGAITSDPEGRIVVALAKGVAGVWGTTIVRLTPAGVLDTTFGAGGTVDVPSGAAVSPVHVEVQRNGRIVVVDSIRVIQLRSNGSLDTSWDTDGVLSPIPGLGARVRGADVQPDGRVVLASSGAGAGTVTVARLTSSGAPDPTFAGGSTAVIATGELFAGGVYDLAVQRDGRILFLVFGSDGSVGSAPVVWQLRYNGARDSSFGTAGWRAIETPGVESVGRALTIAPDGDIVVTGSFYDPSAFGSVARLDGGRGAQCAGRAATVHLLTGERPTSGDDVIVATPGSDTVTAGRGDDVVCGLGGDDVLRGDSGADQLLGGPGADTLVGGDGRDLCVGGPGTDNARTCEQVSQVP